MMHIIRVCGPAGWGLLVVSLTALFTIIRTASLLVREGRKQRIKLQYRLNALIFWGFMGAALGFLGQTSAIHQAMTAIIPAESISPEMIDRGFRESFIPSFWGFGILAVSVLLFVAFRLIIGRGTEPSAGRPSRRGAGNSAPLFVFLLVCSLASASTVSAGNEIEFPEALTSKVWMGRIGIEDIVFVVWSTDDGSLAGEAHTLRKGKHMTQSPATRVAWTAPYLEMQMNTGVILEGTLDTAGDRMDGRLTYMGRPVGELQLEGVDPAGIAGLSARQAPPSGEPLYSYSIPAETDDGWHVSDPEAVGLDRAALESLVTDVIDGKAGILHSLLIARGGKLVLEEYFHGYTRDDLHRLASVTKSVSSLIVGLAVDRGVIGGVETPLADIFPEYGELFDGDWKKVTLKHLLTMSIGTSWTEEEAERTHGAGNDFFRKLLSRDFSSQPGERWQYVSANVNLLGGVIKNATGMHADEFAAEHLFAPLGIGTWNWDYGMVGGYRLMDGSLMLRPRDMAKLGALIAGKGNWNGERVISAEWIAESTSPQIVPSDQGPEKYGYLWWLFYVPSAGGVREAVVANGRGSQFIVYFPSIDILVVTTGSNDENRKQFAIGRLLSTHILDRL